MVWNAIAVTCKTKDHADAVRSELTLRQRRGFLPKDIVLLCVEDPQKGLGSGGATLNALLVVAEHLSAKNKLTVVSTDILENAWILVIHLGRYFSHDPCGRAFVALPLSKINGEMEDAITNFDFLYYNVWKQLNAKSPPGVWVCSSDAILSLPPDIDFDLQGLKMDSGVCCISVPASTDYAKKHGVYKIGKQNVVSDIIYKGKEEEIRSCLLKGHGDNIEDQVSLVSGIVFFSVPVAEKLLLLHTCHPVDACTYMGIDSGVEPIQISLYFDILLCMAVDVSRDDFVCGKRGSSFGHEDPLKNDKNMELVRSVLWDHLRGTEMKAVVIKSARHQYLEITDTPLDYTKMLTAPDLIHPPGYVVAAQSHSFVEESCITAKSCTLVNSLVSENTEIQEGSFIAHSHLNGAIKVGKNCVIINLDDVSCGLIEKIPDNSFVMGCNIKIVGFGTKKVFCCLWDCDKISLSDDLAALICERKEPTANCVTRNDLLKMVVKGATPLPPSYLNHIPGAQDSDRLHHKTLFTAKLFPVVNIKQKVDVKDCLMILKDQMPVSEFEKWKTSWKFSVYDLLELTDHVVEVEYRRTLSVKIACNRLKHILTNNIEVDVYPLYVLGVTSGRHEMLLSALDEAALCCAELQKTHLCARVFSCMAEVLAFVAGDDAGLRSGPAANKEWKNALLLLERKEFKEGIMALSEIRVDWMDNPDSLIRCARHYERAGHIFIRHACTTVSKSMRTLPGTMVEKDTWVVCECPTRIDLSGGWSDTPPICYENGGSVIDVALLLEGKRPVGARVRRIEKPEVVMVLLKVEGKDSASTIICDNLEQFRDYCQPQAQGALLKTCIVLCEVISLESKGSLKDQLLERYDGGIEIQCWSNLPRGSGLGTSSILAGAIIMALLNAVGRVADIHTVLHAVVMAEQMLTTGGGYQDQVGGMVGGIKMCSSNVDLPLKIIVEPIRVNEEFLQCFEERIKLIYTGKTRLARNVLQDVLRNWHAKKPEIIENCKNLVSNALKCKDAFEEGDIAAVGRCVDEYWKQKKIMAPGCEPSSCTEIMKILKPYVLGQTLAGAGGGGFLCVILKEPKTKEFLHNLLKDAKGADDLAIYDATVDKIGIQLYKMPVQ